jgi:hypothetical protein
MAILAGTQLMSLETHANTPRWVLLAVSIYSNRESGRAHTLLSMLAMSPKLLTLETGAIYIYSGLC